MKAEELKVEKNTGYIAPVSASDSVAHVEETKRKAFAEQQVAEKHSATGNGNAESNVVMDGILEVLGVKTAASLVQVVDERLSDKAASNSPSNDSIGGLIGAVTKTIDDDILERTNRAPGTYEGIYERANIAAYSLDLDPKHVNTDKWGGTDTEMKSVREAKMAFRKTMEHDLLPQIRGVELQHQAMIGQAQRMAPALGGMANGPSIHPESLLREAERIKQDEDWTKRTEGGTWS